MATGYSQEWTKSGSYKVYVRIKYSTSFNASTRKSTITLTPQIKCGGNYGNDFRGYNHGLSGAGIYGNSTSLYALSSNYGSGNYLKAGAATNTWTNFSPYSGSISTFQVSHGDDGKASFTVGFYGSVRIMYNGTLVSPIGTKAGNSITITEAAKTYSVTYNANGHGTAPASQTKTYGTALTLQSFIADQTTQGDTYNYTITGNANGGTWSGSNGSATKTSSTTYAQTSWNTNSSGTGTSYASQASYTTNAGLALYAIWNSGSTTYSYTYTLPTGTPTKTEVAVVSFNANVGFCTVISRGGTRATTFNGWWTDPTGGTQRTTNSQVSANETVYAHYTSGSGSFTSVTLPTAQECTKGTTELLGWSTDSSATVPDYLPGATYVPTENTILYAVWKSEGSVHIDNGTSFDVYAIYIDNGTSWDQYIPYIDNGTSWDIYS